MSRRLPKPCRPLLAIALAIAPLAAGAPAWAEPTAEERAAARTLFDAGRKLMAEGQYAAACPKLQEAHRIDPGIGTLYNLADCQEHIGKLASAWANFADAAGMAKAAHQEDRAEVAIARAAALQPKLTRFMIVAVDPPPGMEVRRDGVVVARVFWGTPVPLDPGDHVISATAPGKKPWQATVSAKGEGAVLTVRVPVLADAPPEPPKPLAPVGPPPDPGLGKQRIAAIAVGAGGLVGGAIGVVLGIVAKTKYDDSLDQCPDKSRPNVCYPAAQPLRAGAIHMANGSTAAFVAGGVLLVGGVTLWLTAPSKKAAPKPTVGVQADLGPGHAGLGLIGRF